MIQSRVGETKAFPFRAERIYFSNNQWFFLVRGGESKGPFEDRDVAQRALDTFVTQHIETRREQLRAAG